MNNNNFTYYKGGDGVRERIELQLKKSDGTTKTTCVIDTDLLLCGIRAFPCGNGDDYTLTTATIIPALTTATIISALEFLNEARSRYTAEPIKTLDNWYTSGIDKFSDYCFPGDTVAEDIVDYFMNILPPASMGYGYLQAGEAHSHEDDGNGRYRATYTTFSRSSTEGLWIFNGYCFMREVENRADARSSIQKLLDKLMPKAGKEPSCT